MPPDRGGPDAWPDVGTGADRRREARQRREGLRQLPSVGVQAAARAPPSTPPVRTPLPVPEAADEDDFNRRALGVTDAMLAGTQPARVCADSPRCECRTCRVRPRRLPPGNRVGQIDHAAEAAVCAVATGAANIVPAASAPAPRKQLWVVKNPSGLWAAPSDNRGAVFCAMLCSTGAGGDGSSPAELACGHWGGKSRCASRVVSSMSFACSICSREEETKFQKMKRGPSIALDRASKRGSRR